MKKVLVISASPRRNGNSDTLCDEFIRGAREAGNECEKVFLRDKKIGYCNGCGVCNDTHRCVLKDDMEEILDSLVTSDVIVFATPVYFYTMDGQMKTLIDRTVPRYTEIRGKDFYYIMTAADGDASSLERVISEFRGFTLDCLSDPHEKGIILGTGAWQIGEIKSSPAMKQAYEAGRSC